MLRDKIFDNSARNQSILFSHDYTWKDGSQEIRNEQNVQDYIGVDEDGFMYHLTKEEYLKGIEGYRGFYQNKYRDDKSLLHHLHKWDIEYYNRVGLEPNTTYIDFERKRVLNYRFNSFVNDLCDNYCIINSDEWWFNNDASKRPHKIGGFEKINYDDYFLDLVKSEYDYITIMIKKTIKVDLENRTVTFVSFPSFKEETHHIDELPLSEVEKFVNVELSVK